MSCYQHETVDCQVERIRSDSSIFPRIYNTKCLIVDEVSMLSARMLERLHYVTSKIKGSELPFGGMQVVFVGDFFQLGPVPNNEDTGSFAFTSSLFQQCHTFILKKVYRQTDKEFVDVINQVSRGTCSPANLAYLTNLAEQNIDANKSTVLFGTNNECDEYNMDCLLKHEGEMWKYNSIDHGNCRGILAEKILCLKVGCPVVLLRNLSQALTNGTMGTVVAVDKDGPTVKFPSCIKKLSHCTFKVVGMESVASPTQTSSQYYFALKTLNSDLV